MKGYYCDNCECHLEQEDFVEYGSWSYTCPECGFRYVHGYETADEQVYKFNHNGHSRDEDEE